MNPSPSQASGSRHSAQRKAQESHRNREHLVFSFRPEGSVARNPAECYPGAAGSKQLLAGREGAGGGLARRGVARGCACSGGRPGDRRNSPIRTFYAARPHPLQSLGCSAPSRGRGRRCRSLAVPPRPAARSLFRAR